MKTFDIIGEQKYAKGKDEPAKISGLERMHKLVRIDIEREAIFCKIAEQTQMSINRSIKQREERKAKRK